MSNLVFGPIKSRRFGWSLGIDVSGEAKQCNFDCLYCELTPNKPMKSMHSVLPLEVLVSAIKQALAHKYSSLDVLTTTANGEPTLYPHLEELITTIKPLIPSGVQSLILSNGTRLGNKEVQKALLHYDIVKFSLDAIWPQVFNKIDRPHKNLPLESILEGILDFASQYQGFLVAEMLLVAGINDQEAHIQDLAAFLQKVPNLARVDLSSIDRPPAYKVQPLTPTHLLELATYFEGLPISLPSRIPFKITKLQTTPQAFLDLLKYRPLSVDEARCYLTPVQLERLSAQREIVVKKVGCVDFYHLP
ncbi:radical SAM protein [Helicobacter suis]|uniref:radical SAM protein n=1 Tax=Helicobacter suis TaxID=104628 RepID=UPI001F071544|nr:radical SAM protein [Helicobacter suis]